MKKSKLDQRHKRKIHLPLSLEFHSLHFSDHFFISFPWCILVFTLLSSLNVFPPTKQAFSWNSFFLKQFSQTNWHPPCLSAYQTLHTHRSPPLQQKEEVHFLIYFLGPSLDVIITPFCFNFVLVFFQFILLTIAYIVFLVLLLSSSDNMSSPFLKSLYLSFLMAS